MYVLFLFLQRSQEQMAPDAIRPKGGAAAAGGAGGDADNESSLSDAIILSRFSPVTSSPPTLSPSLSLGESHPAGPAPYRPLQPSPLWAPSRAALLHPAQPCYHVSGQDLQAAAASRAAGWPAGRNRTSNFGRARGLHRAVAVGSHGGALRRNGATLFAAERGECVCIA